MWFSAFDQTHSLATLALGTLWKVCIIKGTLQTALSKHKSLQKLANIIQNLQQQRWIHFLLTCLYSYRKTQYFNIVNLPA